jgi:hypothetical protein
VLQEAARVLIHHTLSQNGFQRKGNKQRTTYFCSLSILMLNDSIVSASGSVMPVGRFRSSGWMYGVGGLPAAFSVETEFMITTIRNRTHKRQAIGSHVWPGFNPNNIVNPNNIIE